MSQTTTIPDLVFERTLNAPIQKVFEAWTTPDVLAKWFAPGPMGINIGHVDARVGGDYAITMIGDDGEYTCFGTYTAVQPHTHLAFTFNWKQVPLPKDTVCTVDLKEDGGKTHMRFVHKGFPDAESRSNHEEGWLGCLDKLPAALA